VPPSAEMTCPVPRQAVQRWGSWGSAGAVLTAAAR
jgi:hypothetical protein